MFAIVATSGVAALLAWGSLSIIRSFLAPQCNHATLRCAIANLCGPGNRSRTLIVALSVSLVIMIATFEGRSAVIQSVLNIIPNGRTGLYVAGFQNSSTTGDVAAFVRSLPGVTAVDMMTQVRLQLRSVDRSTDPQIQTLARHPRPASADPQIPSTPARPGGICDPGLVLHTRDGVENLCVDFATASALAHGPPESGLRNVLLNASRGENALDADHWNYLYFYNAHGSRRLDLFPSGDRFQPMTVDYYLQALLSAELNSGQSFLAICSAGTRPRSDSLISAILAPGLAAELHAKPGSKLVFDSRDKTIEAVVAIASLSASESVWSSIKLDCSPLAEDSLLHQAAVTISDDQIPAAVRAIRERYPALAVITSKEIEQTVTALTAEAMSLARTVAWYAIAGGLCVLIAVVAASRSARMSEIAILASLGAPRATIFKIYSLEFAVLGLIASLIATSLAWGLTAAVLRAVVHRNVMAVDWRALAAMVVISMAIALAGCWLPTFRLLQRKPMEVFRSE